MSLRSKQPSGWAIALALIALYVWQLGAAPLFDVDEGAFSEATRELLSSGDWGHTTLNGTDRFDKPILVYWLQALSVAIFGVNEWATRLPSALCVLTAIAATYRFTRPRWGQTPARLAVLILGSGLGLLAIGRASTADGLLNSLLILTSLSLWTFAETQQKKALNWAYFWSGLGLLAKGPVAVIVPGGALFLWSMFSDRGHTALRALWHPRGWLIMLGTALPWYVYAWQRHGMAFIDGFFMRHNVERFTGTLEGHGGGFFYYLIVLPVLLLPWSSLLVSVLRHSKVFWQQPLPRFLLLWAGFVLVLFSASGTKLPHYMLYGVAPLALLMSQHLNTPLSAKEQNALWVVLCLQLALAASLPTGLPLIAPYVRDVWIRGLFATAPDAGALPVWSSVVACLVLGLWRFPAGSFVLRYGSAVVLVGLLWVSAVIPWMAYTLQGPFKAAGIWAKQHNETIVQWRMHQPSFAYYRAVATPRGEPEPHQLALIKRHRLPEFPYPCEIVFENRGLLLVRRLDIASPAPQWKDGHHAPQ
jgi:4-amino-4-deoxy-L-arabinose transferase-like glycosyltransferase